MKIFIKLPRFIARVYSGSDPEVEAKDQHAKDSPLSERVWLVGLRSPGEQLHVVALKRVQANAPDPPSHRYSLP